MSTILEEGIGFGGNESQNTAWERIKDKYPNTSPSVNLDPALSEIERFHQSKDQVEQSIDEVSKHSETKRFITQIPEHEVIGGKGFVSKLTPESLEKTKNITQTFMKKMENYPKHLSHEGSTVLCVLLSLNPKSAHSINNLPSVDKETIRGMSPYWPSGPLFEVEFDESKDFILKFDNGNPYTLTMFNSVIHPRPEDMVSGTVQVEKDGDKIAVGGKILLDKKGIKRLIGVEPLERDTKPSPQDMNYQPAKVGWFSGKKWIKEDDEGESILSRRQPVAGRNAFELRSDLVEMAMTLLFHNESTKHISPEEVVSTAKVLYSFVENKR